MNAVLIQQKPKDYIWAVNGFTSIFFQSDSETADKVKVLLYWYQYTGVSDISLGIYTPCLVCNFLFALAVDTVN